MPPKEITSDKNDISIIDLTPENIAEFGVCGYKDMKKHIELKRKIDWFSSYYKKGLRTKIIFSKKGGYQGMIEYIPGKFAHRPVKADDYMFIHCIFVGFKKEYKGKGLAGKLLEMCIEDALSAKLGGVAAVTRKGPFMAGKKIFEKKGFIVTDKASPDFEMMAFKFNDKIKDPVFRKDQPSLKKYKEGLTIIRSPQCPYSVKNVDAIIETAKNKFDIDARLIEADDHVTAQETPSPFGTFCIIYKGEVISHHPISNTRFENIMKKLL